MKKTSILAVLMIVILCFAFVGCSSTAGQESSTAPETSASEAVSEAPATQSAGEPSADTAASGEKFKVGFSNASVSNPWRVAMVETFDYEVGQNSDKIEVITTDANDDPQKQLADCEDLISQGIDALIVSPSVTDALTPIIKKCQDQQIPLVVIDRAIGGEGYDAFVRTDGAELGKIAAESVNEVFDGQARICYISGFPGSGPDNERSEGFYTELENYPGIEVLAEQPGNWDEATSLTVMENLIQGYPDMDAVVTSDGTEAISALKAIKAANKEDQIKIIVMDNGRNDSLTMLKDGAVSGNSSQNPVYCGAWGVRVTLDLLEGKELNTTEVKIAAPTLNADNVSTYIDSSLGDTGFPWKALYEESLENQYNGYFE